MLILFNIVFEVRQAFRVTKVLMEQIIERLLVDLDY